MGYLYFLLFVCGVFAVSSLPPVTLTNGIISLTFDENGLNLFKDVELGRSFVVVQDGFQIQFQNGINVVSLNNKNMKLDSFTSKSTSVIYQYSFPSSIVLSVLYELEPNWHFVSKQLSLQIPVEGGQNVKYLVTEVSPFVGLEFKENFKESFVQSQRPCSAINLALFLRTTDNFGLFALIQNPFFTVDTATMTLTYAPGVNGTRGQEFYTDRALLGGYKNKFWFAGSNVNTAERDAVAAAVHQFLIHPPTDETVKVNIAWDENDYQMDISTPAAQTEYFRIIDKLAQFGVSHIVTQHRNDKVSSRKNATDSWGWEETLWLCLGEKIREGYWYPGQIDIPPTVQVLLDYAKSKGIYLMAYIYPILAFSASDEWLFVNNGVTYASLANEDFQNWLLKTLLLFQQVTGIGGFAFDYTFFNDPHHSEYSQWKGWMKIVESLRLQIPDLRIDHRQLAHCYGPWYTLSGSYSEPLASDENPETYGIIIPDLSTDRIAALTMRSVNFWYRQEMFIPMARMPGFTFHQTERYYPNGTLAWEDWLIRDFDYMGYKYSLLSNIATAGLNLVLTMIPARDPEEFSLFPAEDVAFIQNWLKWTDKNIDFLQNTIPILNSPGPGKIDGTTAFLNNEGYMFLFNPNYDQKMVVIPIDESINLSNDGSKWLISEIFPQQRNLFIQSYSDSISLSMDGITARVFQFSKFDLNGLKAPLLFNVSGTSTISAGVLEVNANSEAGTLGDILVLVPLGTNVTTVKINGLTKSFKMIQNRLIVPNVHFVGTYFPHAAKISLTATGNSYMGNFIVPSALKDQLTERQKKYPIQWQEIDFAATWLVPNRLLLFINILNPSDSMSISVTIDNQPQKIEKGYNTRNHIVSNRFSGFYVDVTNIAVDQNHQVKVELPKLAEGQFVGLFFENVETIVTSQVEQME